jgi:putative ABC transport system permease protein
MRALLRALSWPEWRHHPVRHFTALLAVALGVALAFSVHLINASALSEFSAAVRSINGQPDFELRAQRQGFDEAVYARVAAHPQVAAASPVIEIDTFAVDARGQRAPLRVLGLDAFSAGSMSPALVARPADGEPGTAVLDPDALFLNPAAQRAFGSGVKTLRMQAGAATVELRVRGTVGAEGGPLAVIDIAGAQQHFGWLGRLSRIDVRLAPGADKAKVIAELQLPAGVRAADPDESALRVSNLSRAYRVNLTVLALVALFTGAFLVFSVLALAVAQRQPQFALLGVLGLSARERLALVIAESAVLGLAGSAAGIALGTALAALALRWLSGDLGGGYFPGVSPTLRFSVPAASTYGALGVAAAVAGGWLPARMAQRLAPAQALKGLGAARERPAAAWQGPALLALGGLLALMPPVGGMPLAAYVSVALLLLGGIGCVPAGVTLLLRALPPADHALALLAVERARDQRHHATIAVAGVVASLSLAVALTVMVSSFRSSVTQWLGTVLPAELYVRTATSTAASDTVFLPERLVDAIARVPGVARTAPQRVVTVVLDPTRPAIALIARPIDDPAKSLPLVGRLVAPHATLPAAYVSEAMASLYGAAPGSELALPMPDGRVARFHVRGTWRDYARQHGAVMVGIDDYRRITGDLRVNDMSLWLEPGADMRAVQEAIRALAPQPELVEFATPGEIRAVSLAIFDRSFAVTYWLQAVAIGIGLFGIAASFSAQVLARRKEFGLLAHLGLTRAEVLAIVAGEGAVWTAAGALLGVLLGLAVSTVLVHVVNPQSFHWTMDLLVPWGRLTALFAAVMAAGVATAWLAGRKAASRDLALAVKEDW